jgi:hypothetical protein
MTLREFANRLDEINIGKIIAKVKSGTLDPEKLSFREVGDFGITDDKGQRISPEAALNAFKAAGVDLSDSAKSNITNLTRSAADLEREADIVHNKAEVEKRTQQAEKERRLMARTPVTAAKKMAVAWNR